MKKLLVFLSIFGVLFVSTIRPLHAEFLDDDFSLINGNTYYFIIDSSVEPNGGINILTSTREDVVLVVDLSYTSSSNSYSFFEIEYGPSNGPYEYANIPLVYLGEIDVYFGYNDTRIENPSIYSFVWSLPTYTNLAYDDYFYAIDTENPIPPISIYDTIYSLVNKYVFGNNIESGSHQDLTATILSTTICVLVFALPFLIIWKVIKIIMG